MSDWFKYPLGQSIVQSEVEQCEKLIPSGYYAHGLQVGMPWVNYLFGTEVTIRYIADTSNPLLSNPDSSNPPLESGHPVYNIKDCHRVVSTSFALPFPEKSQDIIVLPHTLDFCTDPHEVLRQVSQMLVSEGCMVIVGFNLVSLYGVINTLDSRNHNQPWDGRFYRVGRVQDWLALLGFDLVGAGMSHYLPPIQSGKWREKLAFIEKAGNRWWPNLGGIYVIVARKRERGITPLRVPSRPWRRLIPGMVQPASREAARVHLKVVSKN